jgi:hypothetical protein
MVNVIFRMGAPLADDYVVAAAISIISKVGFSGCC